MDTPNLFDDQSGAQKGRRVYRVAELTQKIKSILEDDIGVIWVEGEISNLRRPASGHMYFTLKDEHACLQAVLFRGRQRAADLQIQDGQKVRLHGQLSVYAQRGQYQIIVQHIEDAGAGDLQQAFEAMKKKLKAEGLFAQETKKPLPLFPRQIGMITSGTGAALRDMLNVLQRRFAGLHIVIVPAKVQGEGSAQEIAGAIQNCNQWGKLDVLIVARGGGSLEDLWAFNEELVARAIWNSSIPVISGVGHETDFTIADFVADVRAPTPSAAAELVIGQKQEFVDALRQTARRLMQSMRQKAQQNRHRFDKSAGSYVFREPAHLVGTYRDRLEKHSRSLTRETSHALQNTQQRMDELDMRIIRAAQSEMLQHRNRFIQLARHPVFREPAHLSRRQRKKIEELETRMNRSTAWQKEQTKQKLQTIERQLHAYNPAHTLKRGFSITRTKNGKIISSVKKINPGEAITSQLYDGEFEATVETVKAESTVRSQRSLGMK